MLCSYEIFFLLLTDTSTFIIKDRRNGNIEIV